MTARTVILGAFLMGLAVPASLSGAAAQSATRQTRPPEASVYIGWPNDGEVVSGRFKVWFGLRDFGVAPAEVAKENTGHHHLLIDTPPPPMDQPIPSTPHILHFGKGQTETTLELPPGRHTLQLLLGDAEHVPHQPPLISKRVTVTVRGTAPTLSAR